MKKRRFMFILIFFCIFLTSIGQVKATMVPVTGTIVTTLSKDDEDTGNDFITQAIQSLDKDTAKKEKNKNYIKNFYNSSQTAMTDGLNFLKPHTVGMFIINFITMLFEMIGTAFSFLVLISYNFASSSLMTTMVQTIFDKMDKVLFDWSDPNSWIMKVLVISTLIGIGYQLVKNFSTMTNWKRIMQVVISGFISMSFIIFIGINGRKIMGGIDTTLQDMIVQTFVFPGQEQESMEITNKENIFNILQLQPFMLRHYGTASYETIAASSEQNVNEAKKRVQTLLDDPSEENAEKEYDNYKNNAISHDIGSCSQVLFLSIIDLIHRVLISIVIEILCVIVGIVRLAKEILLALSVYQLIWWLIKRDHKAKEWFTDRLMWSIAAIGVDILFSVALYFILQVCAYLSAINALIMIAFDIILLVLVRFLIKNIGMIAAKLKSDGGVVLQAMLAGNTSPIETFKTLGNSEGESTDSDGNALPNSGDNDSENDDTLAEGESNTEADYDNDNEDLADTGDRLEKDNDFHETAEDDKNDLEEKESDHDTGQETEEKVDDDVQDQHIKESAELEDTEASSEIDEMNDSTGDLEENPETTEKLEDNEESLSENHNESGTDENDSIADEEKNESEEDLSDEPHAEEENLSDELSTEEDDDLSEYSEEQDFDDIDNKTKSEGLQNDPEINIEDAIEHGESKIEIDENETHEDEIVIDTLDPKKEYEELMNTEPVDEDIT